MFRGSCRRRVLPPIGGLFLYCFTLFLMAPLLVLVVDETAASRFLFCSAFSITTTTTRQNRASHFCKSPSPRHNRPYFLLSSLADAENDSLRTHDFIIDSSSSSSSSTSDEKLEPVQQGIIIMAAVEELPDPRRRRSSSTTRTDKNVGGYDPSERLGRGVDVGDPQIIVKEKEFSVSSILKELAAIQQQGPQKYCILGTRHCSYLHQQIIELLAYALVLSGNHVYTSGAGGTHAATIRGALRAERPDLLTVVLPQSMSKQTKESQELLERVDDVIAMPQNDEMSLDIASRICNSYLLSQTDQLISFAFHESTTVIEATKEAKKLDLLVTVLFLD